MKNELLGGDVRPRIHIWPTNQPVLGRSHLMWFQWSFGPNGLRGAAETVGDAVESALCQMGYQPAVIILEPVE